MQFNHFQTMFNRSLEWAFPFRKLALTFFVLLLCGIFVVFCRGLALNASYWVALSLTFLPFFLCAGIILAMGIMLIRIYHDEIKQKEVDYTKVFLNSWQTMMGATYFSIPMILCYLLLWMLLGIFLLLNQVPGLGSFLGVVLAFAPFLLNLAALFLCIITIGALFFLTPIIALKGLSRTLVTEKLVTRLKSDLFSNMILLLIATFPFWCLLCLMLLAVWMTGNFCSDCQNAVQVILQWFFIMIPFTALLAPAVVFFFNFAAEAHVMMKQKGE